MLGYLEVLHPYRTFLWDWNFGYMFWSGYWNKIEPLSGSFEQFAIFLLCGVVFSHLVPIQAYVRVFWGPTTLQNPPVVLIFWFYNLVWVQDQNRSFVLDFWGICDFSPVGSRCFVIWGVYGPMLGCFEVLKTLQYPPEELYFQKWSIGVGTETI